jgi:hypothetical protein
MKRLFERPVAATVKEVSVMCHGPAGVDRTSKPLQDEGACSFDTES